MQRDLHHSAATVTTPSAGGRGKAVPPVTRRSRRLKSAIWSWPRALALPGALCTVHPEGRVHVLAPHCAQVLSRQDPVGSIGSELHGPGGRSGHHRLGTRAVRYRGERRSVSARHPARGLGRVKHRNSEENLLGQKGNGAVAICFLSAPTGSEQRKPCKSAAQHWEREEGWHTGQVHTARAVKRC